MERWRVAVAASTLSAHGGGCLVVSGHGGEAERLAALAPPGIDVVLEPTARSTRENVERSLPLLQPLLVDGGGLALASDRFHRRRILRYLQVLQPDLLPRVVDPVYGWHEGWWMDAGGALYASSLPLKRAAWRLRPRRARDGDAAGWP